MKIFVRALFISSIIAAATAAHASTLTGTTVTGSFSGAGNVSFGSPTAVIGSQVEFTATGSVFAYSADFNDTGVLISESCIATMKFQCTTAVGNPFTETFTDAAFLGGDFEPTLASGLGILGFTYNLSGSTLTVSGEIGSVGNDALAFTPAPTPEPSSLVLLGTGALGLAGALRRRFR